MDKLFTPGKIGKLTIKNRAVLAPMQMMYGEHLGYAGEKAIAYYEERARGGVGLIIVEGVNVDEVNNKPWNLQMSLASDKYTASFQPLTEAIHRVRLPLLCPAAPLRRQKRPYRSRQGLGRQRGACSSRWPLCPQDDGRGNQNRGTALR